MGWNQGYTIFEATTIAAYNADKLDKVMLSAIMEPYRDSDIDSGGCTWMLTKDGKSVEQIAVEAFGLKWFTPEEDPDGEKNYEAFSEVSDHFGWC